MVGKGGTLLLEALFQLLFSNGWLLTLQDIAPVIGIAVLIIIGVVLVVAVVKWYQYCVRKGFEEYEKEHGKHE